jgi:cellulose synthase/poly-beta-1,6-N-acetylglucosamine synthase-like glycosyltransferase
MLLSILHIIFYILFFYLGIITLYFFIAAIAGKIRKQPVYSNHPEKKKIAVLIPSYKEDEIIVNTATRARQHDYPSTHFEVYVAAHHLNKETIEKLRAIPVQVLEVEFEIGSKARSLNKLLNVIPENLFDVAIILDADNIMLPGCLEKVNHAFQKGFRSVQSHRIAKNKNTPVAVLDAISEEINNHLFRRGFRAMGFSATVIGSGMAFEFSKLREIYNKPGILGNPACDREVDFEVMRSRIKIEFIDDAYVLDEKVSIMEVFERQRTRWLESQVIHLKLFFSQFNKIKKGKEYYNKLFLSLIPPRVIILFVFGLVFILFLLEKATGYPLLAPSYWWWLLITCMYIGTLLISIPASLYSATTAKALIYVPVLMLSMLKAMFKMKVSRKEFLHTPKAFKET